MITLNNDLTLDQVRKYLYEFIEFKGDGKSMPLLYKLIDPDTSLYRRKQE